EVPLSNSWLAILFAARSPAHSRSHSFTIRTAKPNARSEMIRDATLNASSNRGPHRNPGFSSLTRTNVAESVDSPLVSIGLSAQPTLPSTLRHQPFAISHQPSAISHDEDHHYMRARRSRCHRRKRSERRPPAGAHQTRGHGAFAGCRGLRLPDHQHRSAPDRVAGAQASGRVDAPP